MRNLFLSFTLLFFISSINYSQDGEWGVYSFSSTSENIKFADASTGYMVNAGFTLSGSNFEQEIIKTIDGGESWFKCPTPITAINDLFVEDADNVWIIGDNGAVYNSTDGGKNWVSKSLTSTEELFTIDFADENNGWIAGSSSYPSLNEFISAPPALSGTITKTSNGGSNWTVQKTLADDAVVDFYFKDANEGWAIGMYGTILHTIDGGSNWTSQTLTDSLGYGQISFIDNNNGWITGYYGSAITLNIETILYKTSDGGANWVKIPTGLNQAWTSSHFYNENDGIAIVLDDTQLILTLYETTNGGSSWSYQQDLFSSVILQVYFGEVKRISCIDFLNSTVGRICDLNGTYIETNDGGASWQDPRILSSSAMSSSMALPPMAMDVFFLNDSEGWFVPFGLMGSGGEILYFTNDGGANFSEISTPGISFLSVYFKDSQNGWGIGSSGDFHQTTDGGTSWNLEYEFTDTYDMLVNKITGDSDGNLWICGPIVVYKSDDEGTSWDLIVSNYDPNTLLTESFNAISCNDSGCWITGNGIFLSPSYALSGYLKLYDSTDPINDIFFIDANNGWACGSGGIVLVTNDGGFSWNTQTTPTSTNLRSISFSDELNGWASDGYDFIYTTDGGINWNSFPFSYPTIVKGFQDQLFSMVTYNFILNNSMAMLDINSGWYASGAAILKYTSYLTTSDYLRITTPNGGEVWEAGTSSNITWSYNNVIDVMLEYSSNNGSTWNTIVSSVPAVDKVYNWTIPAVSSTEMLLRASAVENSAISDESNSTFTVSNPSVTVLSPNGGEIWSGGSGQTITWNSQDVDFVKIEYTLDGGINWFAITSSINAGAGSYAWITPQVNSPNMKIKISSVADPNIFDESNNVFAISISSLLVIGTVTGYTGMTIEIPVNLYLSSYDEIVPYNLQGKITYDPSKLEYKNAFTNGGTLLESFGWTLAAWQEGAGVLKFISTGVNPIDENGILMKLSFKIIASGTGFTNLTTTRSDWQSNMTNSLVDETMDGSVSYSVLIGDSQIRGDVNLDCAVDINDALAVVNHTIGSTLLTGQSLINADADMDGDVDVNDYLEILMYTVYGYWNAIALPPSNASVQFSSSYDAQNMSLSVPINILNTDNVHTIQVQFEYDPAIVLRSELASCMNQNNCYTNLTENEPGKSVLSFASPSSITDDFTPANVVFITNGNAEVSISTKYKVNDGELVAGQSIEFGITDVIDNQSLPTEYDLKQNYPNPFNPETTIEFSLPEDGMVNLTVYDNIGREVSILVSEYKFAGNYMVSFQGSDLTSGIYFCRFSCNGKFFVNKMVLLK